MNQPHASLDHALLTPASGLSSYRGAWITRSCRMRWIWGFRLRIRARDRLHGVRIAFPREVRTAGDSRTVLIEMLAQARAGT